MTQTQTDAVRKLREDSFTPKDRQKKFLKPYIVDQLCAFCEQSPEFSKAVLEKHKTLSGCLDSLKITERYHSDLEVYKKAVQYFFPDAVIENKMEIRTAKKQTSGNSKVLSMRFEDFFR